MAEDDIKVKKERDPIMMVCFVVFLLTIAAITGATVYNNYLKTDNTTAVDGSSVSVNYIGTYYDEFGNPSAVIFDTSKWSVANDDKILKSNDFTKNDEKAYKPLSFKVGAGAVLPGFSNAVLGHKVGDRFTVKIPSGEGYNAPDTTGKINTSNIITIPAFESLTQAQYKEAYGHELRGFESLEKSVYGWPATATFNSSDNTITVRYLPVNGSSYAMVDNEFGKVTLVVSSASATNISFKYSITGYKTVSSGAGDKDIKMIMLDFGTKTFFGADKFYITSVTESGGTVSSFTYKTVSERYNQDLYFEIELVSID
jgi:hypothetical protein